MFAVIVLFFAIPRMMGMDNNSLTSTLNIGLHMTQTGNIGYLWYRNAVEMRMGDSVMN